RVSAAGGQAKQGTALDSARHEASHSWAQFLPDGRHFIYLSGSTQPENNGIYGASLDSPQSKRLVATSFNGAYAAPAFGMSGPGYLLFLRGDTLMAQPLDTKKLELSGEPFPIAEQVLTLQGSNAGSSYFSVSANGSLAYRHGAGIGRSEIVWLDRNGKRLGT